VLLSPTKWDNEVRSKTSLTFAINKAQNKGTQIVTMEKWSSTKLNELVLCQ
jgi:hypothetical protein